MVTRAVVSASSGRFCVPGVPVGTTRPPGKAKPRSRSTSARDILQLSERFRTNSVNPRFRSVIGTGTRLPCQASRESIGRIVPPGPLVLQEIRILARVPWRRGGGWRGGGSGKRERTIRRTGGGRFVLAMAQRGNPLRRRRAAGSSLHRHRTIDVGGVRTDRAFERYVSLDLLPILQFSGFMEEISFAAKCIGGKGSCSGGIRSSFGLTFADRLRCIASV